MPTTGQILDDLRAIANNWRLLAILWHVYFGALTVALVLGARPGRRATSLALSLPLVSVSALAWLTGNPFNGSLFALLAAALAGVSIRLTPDPVRIGQRVQALAGLIMVVFGWFYPHFLETSSIVPYLYAAPTGLIPCPTLSIVIGGALVLDGLESRAWRLAAGVAGVFYGLFGAIRLGVAIDWVLVAGSALILVAGSRIRPHLVSRRQESLSSEPETKESITMSKYLWIAVLVTAAIAAAAFFQASNQSQAEAAGQVQPSPAKPAPTGYMDTPLIPGTQWHIHDDTRPRPAVITPGAKPGEPPSDAIVLFSGKESDISLWEDRSGQPSKWKVVDGAMECVPKSGYIRTKQKFGDVQLHVEFACPTPPGGNSQGRGNSGVFFSDGNFEVQVLDSYDNKSYADGQCGALYGQHPPLVNACRKPGEWQQYDIVYHMPRFEGGELVKPATATVFHNGVLLHEKRELMGPTSHKKIGQYAPLDKGSLQLQDHGNPVRYRNIWVRELEQYENSPTQLDKKR